MRPSGASGLDGPQQPSSAFERLAEQRPEQQDEGQRGDRADESVRPKHTQIAAGANHRKSESILASITEYKRQGEWRKRYADFFEGITDDTEQQHEPHVEHGVLYRVRADRA